MSHDSSISIEFSIWEFQREISFHTTQQRGDGSPHCPVHQPWPAPRTAGQCFILSVQPQSWGHLVKLACGADLLRQSLISAKEREKKLSANLSTSSAASLPDRDLRRLELKEFPWQLQKTSSVHKIFSLTKLKVFLQISEVPVLFSHWWKSPCFSDLQNG